MKPLFTLFAALLLGWTEVALGCRAASTPLEELFRAWFRGPAFTDIASGANAFAGRTTLSSGSASVVVSTTNVRSNSLIFPHVEVALAAGYITQGRVPIASGTSTGTASSTAVYSGDVFSLTWESPNAITSGQALRVNSIVDGISFAIATANSLTTVASGASALWKLHSKDPQGIKVNTISDGAYFTLGWADGKARPVDTVLMWEVRLPGKTTA